ncbi:hypothetical protein J2744_001668 [Halorubrum trapanicum]|uniref:Uncharacterized protein n=1 Tax=Halorubrum trapanicum TaxID=29284 RepID=A0A8J7UL85_9EURY|nr:hypothetical protein [Halorubrum trapanicum]
MTRRPESPTEGAVMQDDVLPDYREREDAE